MQQLASGAPTPPETYYMRTVAWLESGHPDYRWLSRTMYVGTGARNANSVQVDLYSIE